MAAIEKPWGLKWKLDLEEDEEQDTGKDQQRQVITKHHTIQWHWHHLVLYAAYAG